jgi:hypothetical protein
MRNDNTDWTQQLAKMFLNPEQHDALETAKLSVHEQPATCFSGDMMVRNIWRNYTIHSIPLYNHSLQVTLQDGSQIKMRDLHVGDIVQTLNRNEIVYSSVYMFLHRETNTSAVFIRVSVDASNSHIELTSGHVIHAKKRCIEGAVFETMFAQDLHVGIVSYYSFAFVFVFQIGDCLLHVTHDNVVTQRKITHVDKMHKIGIYAPHTETGTIVVNDIVASCHANILNEALGAVFAKSIFYVRQVGVYVSEFLHFEQNVDMNVYLHPILHLLHKSIDLFIL